MSDQTLRATGWQLGDNAADAYEEFLVPVIFEAISRHLVARAGVAPGDDVLDVACGTACAAREGPHGRWDRRARWPGST